MGCGGYSLPGAGTVADYVRGTCGIHLHCYADYKVTELSVTIAQSVNSCQLVSAGTDSRRWSRDREPNLVLRQARVTHFDIARYSARVPLVMLHCQVRTEYLNVSCQNLKVLLGGLVFFTQEQLSEEDGADSQAGR